VISFEFGREIKEGTLLPGRKGSKRREAQGSEGETARSPLRLGIHVQTTSGAQSKVLPAGLFSLQCHWTAGGRARARSTRITGIHEISTGQASKGVREGQGPESSGESKAHRSAKSLALAKSHDLSNDLVWATSLEGDGQE